MNERTKAAWKNFGVYEHTEFEKKLGLGPRKLWFRYGKRSLPIALARSRNKHRPVFRTRMAWQRLTRRYDDSMFWNLEHSLAELIVLGVQNMRKWRNGYPAELSEPDDLLPNAQGGGMEAWDAILAQIEEGFQLYLDDKVFSNAGNEEKFRRARELLCEWFPNLWD